MNVVTLGPVLFFLLLGLIKSNGAATFDPKCPEPQGAGICLEACSDNSGCKDGMICCSNGCGHVCMKPPDPCRQPMGIVGMCRARIPRYTYNVKTDTCEKFYYGGCGGNENNFMTEDECLKKCHSGCPKNCAIEKKTATCAWSVCQYLPCQNSKERCMLPQPQSTPNCKLIRCIREPCMASVVSCPAYPDAVCVPICPNCLEYFVRWTGDRWEKAICDPCKQPKGVIGPCKAAFTRFTYDIKTDTCEEFTYGGCQGNKNNFQTKEECLKQCQIGTCANNCRVEKGQAMCAWSECKTLPCKDSRNRCKLPTPPSTPDCRLIRCKRAPCTVKCLADPDAICVPICPNCLEYFVKWTKKGYQHVDCNADPCKQEKGVVGPCDAAITRYTYDAKKKKCEKFTYGGCDGNQNNFKSKKACLKCRPKHPCKQKPKVPGPCKAPAKLAYSYIRKKNECESFYYNGCGGTDNRFTTMQGCRDKCKSPCKKKHGATGNCKAQIDRYTYNKKKGECIKFTYSGCGGNGNNFKSMADCEKTCVAEPMAT